MNKLFAFVFSIFLLAPAVLEAAVYKGQNEFVKKCTKCHKSGQDFVSTKTQKEWKKLMNNKGEELASIHINSTNSDASASSEYFESSAYAKKAKHLSDFLEEYAKDSGRVPACN
jgi:cytochrome c2